MKRGGFTLIELMIVLVIVGILSAMAYPSLHRYIVRGKRAQVQNLLLQLMQQQERYYSQNNRYLAFSAGGADGAGADAQQKLFRWWSGNSAADSAYELAGLPCVGDAIAQCVRLTATPGTARVDARFRDDECGVLALTSIGDRSASGSGARCWP
jgi:type IV pilus assembly protein PilE